MSVGGLLKKNLIPWLLSSRPFFGKESYLEVVSIHRDYLSRPGLI